MRRLVRGFLDGMLGLVENMRTWHGLLTGRTSNDAFPALRWVQVSHLVVCASQLEREHRLEVLALEEDFAVEAVGEVDGMSQWGFIDDFVDAGGED